MATELAERSIEGKLQLADSLGLESWANAERGKLEEQRLQKEHQEKIEELVGLDFKPITVPEIRERVCSGKHPTDDNFVGGVFAACIVLLVASGIATAVVAGEHQRSGWWFFPILGGYLFLVFIGSTIAYFNLSPSLGNRVLSDWPHDIPYGAMLAVKEARDKGVTDFYIYYPEHNKKPVHSRGMIDPMIVGTKDGILVEVFYWDDGTVYEPWETQSS